MEKFINCCVFIDPDDCANSLTDLLSVFKTLKVAACIKNQSEALELLNKKKIDILFINVDYADFLQLVHKPTFIIGICDQKHSKHLIKYLRQGFFDFLLSPIQKEELYNVVGKALNTYGTYNFLCREKALEANENEILYNKTLLEKTLFTKDSMFLNGPRKSDSLRISFDDVLYLKLEQGNTILYFEIGNNSTERVKHGIENQRLKGSLRVTYGMWNTLYNSLEDIFNALPRLTTSSDNVFPVTT